MPESSKPPFERERGSLARFSGIGFEFAAAVGGFTLVGYWVDRRFETYPTWLLVGAVLGLIGGGYNLIRASLLAMKESAKPPLRKESEIDKNGASKPS